MKKILSALLTSIMLLSLLTVSVAAIPTSGDENGITDPGPGNFDYIHDLTVSLPAANTWADSAWVCEINGTGEDVYIYAVTGSASASYNLGYSVGGSSNLGGWYPNLQTGSDGIVIHTKTPGVYEIRASVPEGTGGAFHIVVSRKPIDLTWFEDLPFTDIPQEKDCTTAQDINLRRAVLEAYANGWMTGTTETTFSPDLNFNRAMLWTVLARMNNVNTTGGYPWYEPARQWAMNAGISDGTYPDRDASLQEVITMLYNQAGRPAATTNQNIDADGPVADWARDAMTWARSKDLIQGGDPSGAVTRAELAVILADYAIVTAQ